MNSEETALPYPELRNPEPKSYKYKPVFQGCIVASVLFGLVCLTAPIILRPRDNRGQTEAVQNARYIGIALLEFDTQFKSFPSAATTSLVTKYYSTHAYDLTDTSSNSLFRQMYAVEHTYTESMFYARIPGVIKPDNIITPGEALKKGEVGFSYISGLSSKDEPLTPIVLTPLIPGTTKFDPKPFDGKAIILLINNSVRYYKIAKDGHIYDDKGIDLLSPKNPIWDGKAPVIHYPE